MSVQALAAAQKPRSLLSQIDWVKLESQRAALAPVLAQLKHHNYLHQVMGRIEQLQRVGRIEGYWSPELDLESWDLTPAGESLVLDLLNQKRAQP